MPVITLTTEFGYKDPAVAVVKGYLHSLIPQVVIVDITHEVQAYNFMEAAYILGNSFNVFPKGSIHIIGVDSLRPPGDKYLLVSYEGHFFIGHDQGIFSLLTGNNYDSIYEIGKDYNGSFPTKDVFVPVAAAIYKGEKPENTGKAIDTCVPFITNSPETSPDEIIATIIYTDRFGNLVTNISKEEFENKRRGRKFTIYARSFPITIIDNNYFPEASKSVYKDAYAVAIFNSSGLLEIALYRSKPEKEGGASSLLGLRVNDTIKIIFE